MLRLRELIDAFQEQERKHGNIECQLYIQAEGFEGHLTNGNAKPTFEFHEDKEEGHSLEVAFHGRLEGD